MALFAKFRERLVGGSGVSFDSLEHINQKEEEKADDLEEFPKRYNENSNVSVFTKEKRTTVAKETLKEQKASKLIEVVPNGNSENVPPSNRMAPNVPTLSSKNSFTKEPTYNTLEKKSSFRIEPVLSSDSASTVSTPRAQDNRFATSRSNSFMRAQGTQGAAQPLSARIDNINADIPMQTDSAKSIPSVRSVDPIVAPQNIDADDIQDTTVTDLIESVFSKVRHNRTEAVIAAIDQGFSVNTTDTFGNTILHICAQNNLRKLAASLLHRYPQMRVNTENLKGLTALDYANKYGFEKVSNWLVQVGAVNGGAQAAASKMSKVR